MDVPIRFWLLDKAAARPTHLCLATSGVRIMFVLSRFRRSVSMLVVVLASLLLTTGAPLASGKASVADTEARAVVTQLIEKVQSGGDFELFEKLFAEDFVDHTPFPGYAPNRDGARAIYKTFRTGFPDFHAEVHLQVVENGRVTSFKTYHGTHLGEFMGLPPTGRKVAIPLMDIVEVRNGRVTAHWGVPNVLVLYQQLGVHRFDAAGLPLADEPAGSKSP